MSGTMHPVLGALPWYADNSAVYARDGEKIAEVAFIISRDPVSAQAREQKIAALIAAAPELASSVDSLLKAWDVGSLTHHEIKAVRIALAAAGGI